VILVSFGLGVEGAGVGVVVDAGVVFIALAGFAGAALRVAGAAGDC
jgi:hypothetical protein